MYVATYTEKQMEPYSMLEDHAERAPHSLMGDHLARETQTLVKPLRTQMMPDWAPLRMEITVGNGSGRMVSEILREPRSILSENAVFIR